MVLTDLASLSLDTGTSLTRGDCCPFLGFLSSSGKGAATNHTETR